MPIIKIRKLPSFSSLLKVLLNQEWVLNFVLILFCIYLDDSMVCYLLFSVNVVDNCVHYQLLSNKLSQHLAAWNNKHSLSTFSVDQKSEWLSWYRSGSVFCGVAVKMSQSSQGCSHLKAWLGLKDLLPRWRTHMAVDWRPQFLRSSPCGPLHGAAWVSSQKDS